MMRHPPFVASAGHSGTDYCTHAGAQKLAEKIRAAWAGCSVQVATEVAPISTREGAVWRVRILNLHNGLPSEVQQ